MEISGHSSTRMLARYTHPTEERTADALELPQMSTLRAREPMTESATPDELAELLKKSGGRQGTRTLGLRVANAALSQLS